MEYKASQGQQGDPALNKANTRLPTLTKIKSKTGTLLIHVQVRRLVWPTALTVLEGVGGRFVLVFALFKAGFLCVVLAVLELTL